MDSFAFSLAHLKMTRVRSSKPVLPFSDMMRSAFQGSISDPRGTPTHLLSDHIMEERSALKCEHPTPCPCFFFLGVNHPNLLFCCHRLSIT